MKDMLQKENIQIVESVKDWKDAIEVAVRPLVNTGYCEERYIDGIIENTNKFGPYYVLCEDFALLHASSEQGAIKTQLGVTLLREPIKFKPDGLDVRALVTLVAADSEAHMGAMVTISRLFGDPESIQKLVDATSVDDIYEQFMSAAE